MPRLGFGKAESAQKSALVGGGFLLDLVTVAHIANQVAVAHGAVVLAGVSGGTDAVAAPQPSARTSRLTVRLRGDDRLLLRERAAVRSMAPATYVSVLTRVHLRSLAPLPREELLALKRTVAELGAIGRNLNQIARAANQGERGGRAGPA